MEQGMESPVTWLCYADKIRLSAFVHKPQTMKIRNNQKIIAMSVVSSGFSAF